jgi:choice-of-anchor B domain-containing protein
MILCFTFSFSQLNVEFVSRVNFMELHDTKLNDVWGHKDAQGKEYALVGARKGTSIVDISTPENPVEVFWEPGLESVWRDLKTWGNYAYVTTEAENGLLIIDMNSLPDASGIQTYYYNGSQGQQWSSAHNIYIDENGYAYIFGANRGNGGVIILDVHTNPTQPIEVGVFDNWYCHDGFVRNNRMYLAHISEGFLSIVDVTSKSNPVLLGTKNTSSNFTHNIWPSDDGNYAYTTDEVSGAFLDAYDVSDPTNIVRLDKIQSSPGKGIIPHNTHFINNFIVTSYYSDGLVIHDVSRPHNIVEVGHYDTYPDQTTSYDGCWGAYPYFESGLVAASDISEGLFILRPSYKRAAYLEGNVIDAQTLNPLNNVKVKIQNHNQTELSQLNGDYATGIHNYQILDVEFSKPAYYPQTIPVNFQEGEVVMLDVALVPIPPFDFQIKVINGSNNQEILDAQVRIEHPQLSFESSTNGAGEAFFQLFYDDAYNITVGKWGFVTVCNAFDLNETTGEIEIKLFPGIYDDFSFDFGWVATKTTGVTQGEWERGIPFGTSTNSAPSIDANYDCGNYAFVTGNHPSSNPDLGELHGGRVTLYSPVFDLTGYSTPYLHYSRWFYNFHGPILPFDDTLEIYLSNGIETVLLDKQGSDPATFYQWIQKSFLITDYISPSNSMQLIITVADEDPSANVTEAGFDFFFVTEINYLADEKISKTDVKLYPNPVTSILTIDTEEIGTGFLFDNQGKVLEEIYFSGETVKIDCSLFNPGIYYIQLNGIPFKVVVLN